MIKGLCVLALFVSSLAFADSESPICGKLIPCGNYYGDVVNIDPTSGETAGGYSERVIVQKLGIYQAAILLMVAYGDGGHDYTWMTLDFENDDGKLNADGKFVIYDGGPNLIGTNKIGQGQCQYLNCKYSYESKFKKIKNGSLSFQDQKVQLVESELGSVNGDLIHSGSLNRDIR